MDFQNKKLFSSEYIENCLGFAQKRGDIDDVHIVNSIKLNETLKSDRQGLNEIPATDFNYTDDYPLPEYKPHSSSAVDDSINTVNIDTLNDVPSSIDYEDDYVNEESPASLLPTTIFNVLKNIGNYIFC